MFGRLLGWYIMHTFLGFLPYKGILPGAKFTLSPSLAFSYIDSFTAWHSSSGHQPKFAAWDKEWNYGTFTPCPFQQRAPRIFRGRPSRWAQARIVVLLIFRPTPMYLHKLQTSKILKRTMTDHTNIGVRESA